MDTSEVIRTVRTGSWKIVKDDPHYTIHECVVKHYPAGCMLLQSSGKVISLGRAMMPLMETGKLHEFAAANDCKNRHNTPLEIYVYHWVDRAQGPMVFDVGFLIDESKASALEEIANQHGFLIKPCPALKVASIAYCGPFPYQPNSGWGNLHWEQRAKDLGLAYTGIYRELYHSYDWDENRHIAEVQMQID